MDERDQKILKRLKENGRKSFTEIAKELGVSEGTIRNRINRMKQENIIEKFTVKTNTKSTVEAFVNIEVSTEEPFNQIINKMPEELEVSEVAGDVDIVAKISRESNQEINKAVDQIRAIEGVDSTKTYMVLSKNQ